MDSSNEGAVMAAGAAIVGLSEDSLAAAAQGVVAGNDSISAAQAAAKDNKDRTAVCSYCNMVSTGLLSLGSRSMSLMAFLARFSTLFRILDWQSIRLLWNLATTLATLPSSYYHCSSLSLSSATLRHCCLLRFSPDHSRNRPSIRRNIFKGMSEHVSRLSLSALPAVAP